MSIDYQNDLLKHYVRYYGWLPICKKRLKAIKQSDKPRSLRYFTFCAQHAMDVLMLDVANLLASSSNKFDKVVFFDRDRNSILDTIKRIPGAVGFPGSFIELMLREDPDEAVVIDSEPLDAPEEREDSLEVRDKMRKEEERKLFIKRFPFDVVNLDLEEFLFKPKDQLPGKVIRAFRKLCVWQKQKLGQEFGRKELSGFSLMFTTQIGPPNVTNEFKDMLAEYLRTNMADDASLVAMLEQRANTSDVGVLRDQQFELFFKLGMPKVIASTLLAEGWYIDSDQGIQVFQFERKSKDGPYQMLHLVMDVVRQSPDSDHRPAPKFTKQATESYQRVTRQLFEKAEIRVTEDGFSAEIKRTLTDNLAKINSRAKKYINAQL